MRNMGNKMNNSFCIFFLFLLQYTFVQSVDVYLVAAETLDVSEEYFSIEDTYSYVNNEVEPATLVSKITIIKAIPAETKVSLTLFGYSMGEYRIPVGMEYNSPLCEVFEEKMILNPAMMAIGFTPDDCPPGPATFTNPGYVPDLTHFPETFPRNQYLVKFEIKLKDEKLMTLQVYVEVV